MMAFKHSKTDDLVVSLIIGFVVTTRAVVYAEHTFFGELICGLRYLFDVFLFATPYSDNIS
jgi:hypothetical protein